VALRRPENPHLSAWGQLGNLRLDEPPRRLELEPLDEEETRELISNWPVCRLSVATS